ncbi:hypothetical protein GCM10011609_87410 [Lentzea pudingi]|uniref:Uncharacterized protein n=1 Tax=Lentzea pudingi TaxID=1789439 RepID=A0ABQ2IWP2_9PSEU|nr:hypothetical protein GCM10011609_87410 [Lentzea pudingi]
MTADPPLRIAPQAEQPMPDIRPLPRSLDPLPEESLPNEAGLDHYQVRSWRAWYAHVTLSMLVHAWLAVARSLAKKGERLTAAKA